MKKAFVLGSILALLLAPVQSVAGERGKRPSFAEAQLVMLQQHANPLPDEQLSDLRGGFNGLAFRVIFEGFANSNGDRNFNLQVNSNTEPSSNGGQVTTTSQGDGEAKIIASVGGFGAARGVFQLAQVPGNNNVITNNLFIQLVLLNTGGTEVLRLSDIFGPGQ